MPTISPTLPNDGETIDAQDVNGPFNAILGVLNGNIDDQNVKPGSLPWSVMDSFSNQIPASAMQDSGNLEKFREDSNISFIPDGLIWSATTGLAGAMTSGSYYSNSGVLLPVTAIASKTFTASKDTYVSIAQNGAIAYSEVANGAAQPSLPSNSNWLAKVVTNGSTVTGVTDMRQTAPIASHNVDFANLGVDSPSTNGAWQTWSHNFAGFTGGSVTVTAKYTKVGKIVYFRLKAVLGASPSGVTNFTFSLPSTAHSDYTEFTALSGSAAMKDANGGYFLVNMYANSTSEVIIRRVDPANMATTTPTTTTPFTWASGDSVTVSGTYESV